MSTNQYLSSKARLFDRLERLVFIFSSPGVSTDTVKFVKCEFKFLDIFLSLQSFTNEPALLDVTQKVHALFQDALVDFSRLHLAEYSDFCTFMVQNKIWLIKKEIEVKYSFPKISSLRLSVDEDGIVIPEFVKEFINTAINNLHDLAKQRGDDPESSCYYALRELRLLRAFVCFVSERFIDFQSQDKADFFAHVLTVTGHASMLAWLYFSGHGYDSQHVDLGEINVLLFLQMKFKPIQPNVRKIYIAVLRVLRLAIQSGQWCSNIQNHDHAADVEADLLETIQHGFMELPTNCNSQQRVLLKDNLAVLQEMLNLLRADIFDVATQDLELLLRDIDTVIIDVGILVYLLYKGEAEEEEEKEVMALSEVIPTQVIDLSGNIRRIISTVKLAPIRKAFQSNYLPRIHGLGYVDFLLDNVKEFQSRHSDSLASVATQLQIIQKELDSLQPFLEFVAQKKHNDLDKIQSCATQLIGKAYEVECLLYACISKKAPVWCFEYWFLDIIEEITLVRDEVAEIHEKKTVGDATYTVAAHTSSNLARSPRMTEEIVGFKDVIQTLRGQLISGTKERRVIPIVGMPGLGKTTLAYRLYFDRLVVPHFDIRAQCCVSRVYSRAELLLEILRAVTGEESKHRGKLADELANELRKALFSKRYLILVDDVWEVNVWDDLIGCFNDASNGSRIILTTRNLEVANYTRFQSDPLQLRMFNEDESWELLRKKVFGEENCSTLLTKIGRQIAEKCGQLPLSIALVAGILAEMEKKEECWEQLANNLGPHIHKDSRAIIEQSYQILPYHLRSCFLYFGSFLEDSVIDVPRLTRLWISEGFIKSCEGKSLEDTAKGYFENLLGRNLVMGTKRRYGGEIKACRVHDLLYDFCKERAKEENLLLWMKMGEIDNPSSHFHCNEQLVHRLSIYGNLFSIGEWSSHACWSHVNSIILHSNCLLFIHLCHIFLSSKFLKVLDLEFSPIHPFPTGLVYLRYFAAQTEGPLTSSFIADSRNLETLILHQEQILQPITLWKMVKLRHLHISAFRFTIGNPVEFLHNSEVLYDLKTLSTPYFSSVLEMDLILSKTPNLRELRCKIKGDFDLQHYALKFARRIEKLKIGRISTLVRDHIIPFFISAPNLRHLTLDDFSLHFVHLSVIALLQNLQVLKLKGIRFGTVWLVSDGDFPELKVLKLQQIDDLQQWIVDDDAFPKLECLVLRECHCLKDIPIWFAEISSLKSITIVDCQKSVEESARGIWNTQVNEYLNSAFEVFISKRKPNQFRFR
ncbi:hypothetical protein P3S67_032474 [Capsicum chacoense]